MWLLPILFVLEWLPEVLEGEPSKVPRWYIYVALWLISAFIVRQPSPNALWVMGLIVSYISINTVREAIIDRNAGAPDPATSLAILVGLSVVAVALARERFWIVLWVMTIVTATVAVVTGIDAQLEDDDLIIRVVGPALSTGLAAWVIRRLRDDLTSAAHELHDAAASRDQLVAAVGHELRTPLTGIVGWSAELEENVAKFTAEETAEFTRHIVEQSRDMADIIDDLLVAARVDTGNLTLRPDHIELERQIESEVESLRGRSEADGKQITLSGLSATVFADPLRTRQIIRNLVSNAIRYGGEEITIAVAGEADEVRVSIIDDGGSLAEGDVERVFEPYFTAHESETVPGSVGLGLPVARRLARLMGGDLTCVITCGRTEFRLSLPVAPSAARADLGNVLP